MKRRVLARITGIAVLAAMIGCASLPPAKPATDLKALAGKWKGNVSSRGGQIYPYTVPALSNPGPRFVGTIKVEGGKYRFLSETTRRAGTYTLHEGDGKRILKGEADDGSSSTEATPAQ